MLRRITLISATILAFLSSDIGVRRASAQVMLTDFEEVDAYISPKWSVFGVSGTLTFQLLTGWRCISCCNYSKD